MLHLNNFCLLYFIARLLIQEVARADSSRHYGLYIDGDIAKLPGGGRRGAAILCELLPDGFALH